jgi:putative FmdB family regulatory protein
MPIYAYRCDACGHAKDVLQKMSDPVLSVCPACGAEAFRKQLTAAGFQLKGSGWYVTDFKGGANAANATKDAEAPAAASGEAKPADGKAAETRPAETKPAKPAESAATPAVAPAAPATASAPTPSEGRP